MCLSANQGSFLAWPIAKDKTSLNLSGFFEISGDVLIGFFNIIIFLFSPSGGVLNCSR